MPRKKQPPTFCKIEGCSNRLLAQGRCSMHYQQARVNGEIILASRTHKGLCSIGECGKAHYGKGYCHAHYEKFKKYGDPLAIAPKKTGMRCTVVGCDGEVVAKGMCRNCYAMHKRYGDPQKRSDWYNKRFREITDDQGYVQVYAPGHPNARKDSRMPKHRFVMSDYLGRALRDNENVHHKNGDKADNTLGNLELWVSSQPQGQRPIDLIKWARAILRDYVSDEAKLRRLEYRNT